MAEIAIVGDERNAVIDARLGDESACKAGLSAGSLRSRSQVAGSQPVARPNVQHPKLQNERKDGLRGGVTQQFRDHHGRDDEIITIQRFVNEPNIRSIGSGPVSTQ